MTNQDPRPRLTVFQSESGITISFGEKTYFIDVSEPFYNIALKALEGDDYIPFYVEVARREGMGEDLQLLLHSRLKKYLPKILRSRANYSNL